jgi:hypothetical protein
VSTDLAGFEQALFDGHEPVAFRYMPDPEQLDLLRDANGKLPANALLTLRKAAHERGRGRPPGSTNKASKQLAKWFIGKYGHPLDVLGEIIVSPTDVLCEQLRLAQGGEAKHKPVRAIDAQLLRLKAVDIALPYICGKQPISIDLNARADVILNIPGLTDPAHLAAFVDGAELTEGELERIEYTPVSDPDSVLRQAQDERDGDGDD